MLTVARAEARSTAAPTAVWERLADGRRWPEWNPAVEWVVVERALRPGDYVTIKPRRGRQTAYRIVRAQAPATLALRLAFGPLAALELRWELSAADAGTAVIGEIVIWGPLAGLLAAPLARRAAATLAESVQCLAAIT